MTDPNPYRAPASPVDDRAHASRRFGCGNFLFLVLGILVAFPPLMVAAIRVRSDGLMALFSPPVAIPITAFLVLIGGLLIAHGYYRSDRLIGLVAVFFVLMMLALSLVIVL